MKNERTTLFIIDGSSIMYRAFHAIPPTFTSSKGMPTNAVYGFTQSLRKILHDYSPHYIGIAFDVKGPSFRHELFTEYKAERPPMPDTLSLQVPYIKQVVEAFNIPVIEKEGFEADDVIATIVKRFEGNGLRVALVTSDKDMYQLVDENTFILDYINDKEYGPAEVAQKFGVGPQLIRDYLGLAGDSSDNIPGVPGVGPKTACKLLNEYGSIEGVFQNVEGISKEKLKENLKTYKDQAFLSRELATLHPQVPVEFKLEDFEYRGPDYALLEPLLNELDFKKILKEMLPEIPHAEEALELKAVTTEGELFEALGLVKERVSFTLNLTEEGFAGKLAGAGFGIDGKRAFYVPCGAQGLQEPSIVGGIKAILEDENIIKHTDDSKALYLFTSRHGIGIKGMGIDTSLASYLINPSRPSHTVEALAYEYLKIAYAEEAGDDIGSATALYAKKSANIITLAEKLEKELKDEGLFGLYTEMELPLSRILADMEEKGIMVDGDKLKGLSSEMEVQLADTERRIYAAAGMEFNINSPKQLAELLFDKLKLKPVKKTKTGFSTDEEVLTQLAARHEVPQLVITYRQTAKLKSTYVDALQELINPVTGRIHTTFNQTVTETGRLSSSKPNLQNIPIRGEAAGRIREAFVPEQGFSFLSADYSQIELRIVAHMSGDPVFIDAFLKGEDIHTRTASEIFGILPDLVTAEMRRRAKAINFGIIYGMGPYGLSTELGIPMKEAVEYINNYFAHYSHVKAFIDRTVKEAAERGYTVTLFGRRRFIPELKSPTDSIVRLGQRLAINTPIQGSAADMIKAAMLSIFRRLTDEGLRSRMILQIHDELIFEAASDETGRLSEIVRAEMEGVVDLKVPVKVNLKVGANWNTVE